MCGDTFQQKARKRRDTATPPSPPPFSCSGTVAPPSKPLSSSSLPHKLLRKFFPHPILTSSLLFYLFFNILNSQPQIRIGDPQSRNPILEFPQFLLLIISSPMGLNSPKIKYAHKNPIWRNRFDFGFRLGMATTWCVGLEEAGVAGEGQRTSSGVLCCWNFMQLKLIDCVSCLF